MNNRFSALQNFSFDDELFDSQDGAPAAAHPAQAAEPSEKPAPAPKPLPDAAALSTGNEGNGNQKKILEAKSKLHRKMLDEFNLAALEQLPRDQLIAEIRKFVSDYASEQRLAFNNNELDEFVGTVVDELTGLGPLEPMMRNPDISDILINGPDNCYAEIKGVLQRVHIPFQDEAHLLRIINKIVAAVGRRIDESNPMCDARMSDGSRFNAAIRPIAIDGPLVSIRKFSKNKLSLGKLVEFNALTRPMAEVLQHAVHSRMTTIISGGTGTGKTTMLNALSAFISEKERIITIEDAAELALHIPHVGRM